MLVGLQQDKALALAFGLAGVGAHTAMRFSFSGQARANKWS